MSNDERLILQKTIYAKRKGLTSEQMSEIFRLEAMNHLRNNPDLGFVKIGKPVENADRSKTFPMYFAVKPVTT
jgi:hypothetical protein